MPAAKKRTRSRPHGRRPARPVRSGPTAWRDSLPVLEQRHLDLLGLALVCLGVFLAFPLYLGWDGGRAGEAIVRGARYLAGEIAYAAPVALVAAGAILVMRPVLPAVRPFRSGALCLLASSTLALAAGTLGLGPGPAAEHWRSALFEQRGGIVGDALHYATATLFGGVGSHLVAVFLFLAGVLLLTGASVAGVLRATGNGLADTTRVLRRGSEELAARARTTVEPDAGSIVCPEPDDSEPTVSRRPRTATTTLDGVQRFPDLFAEHAHDEPPGAEPTAPEEHLEPEPEPEPSAGSEPADAPGEEPDGPAEHHRLAHDIAWEVPEPRAVLRFSTEEGLRPDTRGQEKTATRLVEALGHFGVQAQVIGAVAGPHITRYELRLAPGIKMSKVAQLKDDLAYALAATDIRILAPIPGKQAVGVEVPNAKRKIVTLGDVFQARPKDWSPLTVWLGKDVSGKAIGADLAKMPHILVAGTTGAGKSGCINAMLSLGAAPGAARRGAARPRRPQAGRAQPLRARPAPADAGDHLAAQRRQRAAEPRPRDGVALRDHVDGADAVAARSSTATASRTSEEPLPYILCVIDELADLMMVAPADVEDAIIRLAQKARAVGIHLVLATQSPRVDVITGMIKANVPSRIAFAVSSQTDSRVILDHNGAESLLGQGDMLFSPVGSSKLQRIQGAYIDEAQIAKLTGFWARQGEPELREDLLEEVEPAEADGTGGDADFDPDEDPLLGDAIRLVVEMGTASTSMLQRRLRLGYTRAGRLIDMLERRGVISGYEGSKPR